MLLDACDGAGAAAGGALAEGAQCAGASDAEGVTDRFYATAAGVLQRARRLELTTILELYSSYSRRRGASDPVHVGGQRRR